ncbi:Ankyrin repeat-containing protein [Spatholobus suberectus]|nr:Ankyrin repeat-containing protein [Spatholobus suberectus]
MSMNTDIEMNCPRGEGPSRNAIDEVQAHGQYLSKETYDSIKYNDSASDWRGILEDDILRQKTPMGNTVLHVAAMYGNDDCVEMVLQNASELLDAKNDNGDTALHVGARAGYISTLEMLLAARLHNLPHSYSAKPKRALGEILVKNNQGNTFFHEALLNGYEDEMNILDSQELQIEAGFKELVERAALFWTNKEEKSVLHLAIENGFEDIVDDAVTKLISQHPALDKLIEEHQELAEMIPHATQRGREMNKQQQDSIRMDALQYLVPTVHAIGISDLEIRKNVENMSLGNGKDPKKSPDSPKQSQDSPILIENHQELTQLIPYGPHYVPPGKSPLVVAILKQDQDILWILLMKKKEWVHLRDNEGKTALHYAASIGYLNGVEYLLGSCISCSMERDNDGFFPLHLASAGGHVEVVSKLLEHCLDPKEILDYYGRNIVHIAAQMGKFNVVRYILQDANYGLVDMINDKDANGNTPLHLATSYCRPKIVHALTWDKRVELSLVNSQNQTALDAYMQTQPENPTLQQRLVWIALKSTSVQNAKRQSHSIKISLPPQHHWKERAAIMDLHKDRINTLILVSTLITTVTFAAGFTLPGGTNSSDPGQGMAAMLNHAWFKPFIFCIAISMYGAISVTIILIWAQLGDITLALFALKMARPLLGVTLATLSVAFLAGVYLVISYLNWMASVFLVLCVIFILMLLLLYTILWFPSSSSNLVIRYISYYPFQFLTWLAEEDETKGLLPLGAFGDAKPKKL